MNEREIALPLKGEDDELKYYVQGNGQGGIVNLKDSNENVKDKLYKIGYEDGKEVGNKKKENKEENFRDIEFVNRKIQTITNPKMYIDGYYHGLCDALQLQADEKFITDLLNGDQTQKQK